MKTFKQIIAAVVISLICFVAHVQGADPSYNPIKLVGIPLTMPTQSYSNTFTNQPITLVKDRGIAFWTTVASTNAAAVSNLVFTFQLGFDQTTTNFATTPTLTQTVTANGTNRIITLTYFNTNQLSEARTIRLYSIQNTNVYTVTIGQIMSGQFR